jgi:hypothetical protein
MQDSQEAEESGSGDRKRRREESDEEVDDDLNSCWKPNFNSCNSSIDAKDVLSMSDNSISENGQNSRSWSGPTDLNQSFSSSGTQIDYESMKREESVNKSCRTWENHVGAERPNSWETSVGAERPSSRESSVGAERPNTPESSVGAERPGSRDCQNGRTADGAVDQPQVNLPEDRGVTPGEIFCLSFGF